MTTLPSPSLSTSAFVSLSLCQSFFYFSHLFTVALLSVCFLLATYLSYSCYFSVFLCLSHLPPPIFSSPRLFFFICLHIHKTNFQVDTAGPTSKVNIPLIHPLLLTLLLFFFPHTLPPSHQCQKSPLSPSIYTSNLFCPYLEEKK